MSGSSFLRQLFGDNLARGKSLGYTTPAFHGTRAKIDDIEQGFYPWSHFGTAPAASDRLRQTRPRMNGYTVGRSFGYDHEAWDELSKSDTTKRNALMKQYEAEGRILGEKGPEHVLPLMLNRGKRTMEIRDTGLKNPFDHADVVNSALDRTGDGFMPVHKWSPSRQEEAWRDYLAKQGVDPLRSDQYDQYGVLTKELEKRGIDSLYYRNDIEGGGANSFIMPQPNRVRSLFAEFDPEKTHLPGIGYAEGGYFDGQRESRNFEDRRSPYGGGPRTPMANNTLHANARMSPFSVYRESPPDPAEIQWALDLNPFDPEAAEMAQARAALRKRLEGLFADKPVSHPMPPPRPRNGGLGGLARAAGL